MLHLRTALTLFSSVKTMIFVAFNAGFNSAIVFLVVFIIPPFFSLTPLTFHPNKFLTYFTELYLLKYPIEYAKEFLVFSFSLGL